MVLSLLWNGSASADQAQLFGIKLYKDLFQSIDKDTWLKEKCINKNSYGAFIRYDEVPLFNDKFPIVYAEVSKCKVFGVWGQGFFKKKSKCRKNIEPLMKITLKRIKAEYNISEIKSGNPLRDDKFSKSANISGGGKEMTLYGYCFKDPQGYFMDYGIVDNAKAKQHSKYLGVTDLKKGL